MTKTKRFAMMSGGIALIGAAVAGMRISMFGADPFSCMNLGISSFLGMSFGTWQLICNAMMLALVFRLSRNKLGWGTLVNMAGVGYLADGICMLLPSLEQGLPFALRLIILMISLVVICFGCALYMKADRGVAPYDAFGLILAEKLADRISFRTARIATDLCCVAAGVGFTMLAGIPISSVAGIGTLICMLGTGPLIAFFSGLLDGKTFFGLRLQNKAAA